MKVKSESEVTQLCPTLSDPMDCSLPGSSAHGIFQARVLEWGAIAFSELDARNNYYISINGNLLDPKYEWIKPRPTVIQALMDYSKSRIQLALVRRISDFQFIT